MCRPLQRRFQKESWNNYKIYNLGLKKASKQRKKGLKNIIFGWNSHGKYKTNKYGKVSTGMLKYVKFLFFKTNVKSHFKWFSCQDCAGYVVNKWHKKI